MGVALARTTDTRAFTTWFAPTPEGLTTSDASPAAPHNVRRVGPLVAGHSGHHRPELFGELEHQIAFGRSASLARQAGGLLSSSRNSPQTELA